MNKANNLYDVVSRLDDLVDVFRTYLDDLPEDYVEMVREQVDAIVESFTEGIETEARSR